MLHIRRLFVRRLFVATACLWALAGLVTKTQGPPSAPSRAADASRLIGTWALANYESNDADTQELRGARPIGVLFYDGTGHMGVQIAPDRIRGRFTGPVSELFSGPRPTPDEAFDAIAGYAAYFGTYTVDEREKTVTHKRVANLNPGGLGDFVRRYELPTPDRLVLVPLERSDRRSIRLTWERQK
jgi:hypothetical protein